MILVPKCSSRLPSKHWRLHTPPEAPRCTSPDFPRPTKSLDPQRHQQNRSLGEGEDRREERIGQRMDEDDDVDTEVNDNNEEDHDEQEDDDV